MKKTNPHLRKVLLDKILAAKARGRKLVLPKPLKPQFPRASQLQYTRDLYKAIIKLRHIFKSTVYPKLEGIVSKAQEHRPKKDSDLPEENYKMDYSDDIDRTLGHARIEFESTFSKSTFKHIANKTAKEVHHFNKEESSKQMRRLLGVDIFTEEKWLEPARSAFVSANVNLISKWNDELFSKAHDIILNGAKNGRAVSKIADDLEERIGVTESRYDMIARDQVAKLNGDMNLFRQTELGIEKYTWDTSHDERVRPAHADLDGEVFEWADPPVSNEDGDTNNPGEDYSCRCLPLAYLDDIIEGLSDDEEDQ